MIGRGRAPGKVILSGEHFVVHGAPAIALPVRAVGKEIELDVQLDPYEHALELSIQDPFPEHLILQEMLVALLKTLSIPGTGEIHVTVRSTLLPGAHLGSSAALAVALVRAVSDFRHLELPDDEIARLAFDLERIVHRNPSGIDNTVVALDRPIWFRKGHRPEPVQIAVAGTLLLADSGELSRTADVVAKVGDFRVHEAERWTPLFDDAVATTIGMRDALAAGDGAAVGACMNHNQELLAAIGASTARLEALIAAARAAGALGAKLTGGGGGGNAIALCGADSVEPVREALERAGAGLILDVVLPLSEPECVS